MTWTDFQLLAFCPPLAETDNYLVSKKLLNRWSNCLWFEMFWRSCDVAVMPKEYFPIDSLAAIFFKMQVHYSDVIMGAMASQITSLTVVYSTVHSGADQRKFQSSASLAFVRGIHWWPVNSLHKGPVTRKMFHFDDVIMMKTNHSA